MKKWVLKAVIQKTISYLPKGQHINFLFQKHVTKGVRLTNEYLDDKMKMAGLHHKTAARFKLPPGHNAFEIGTGWYPIIPFTFFLTGSSKIITMDTARLMNRENFLTTLDTIIENIENPVITDNVPSIKPDKIEKLKHLQENAQNMSLDQMLDYCNIEYIVGDARDTGFQENSVDFIISNNTFEHIYPQILTDILKEFRRINKNDGAMSHFIDMSDHFAHLDSSINIYNFLRFSDKQWNFIDNSIQPQNRLRINQYREMIENSGFKIEEENNREGNMEELKKLKIASPFSDMPEEEVAISHSHLLIKPSG